MHAPHLGENGPEVLGEAGFSKAEIAALRETGYSGNASIEPFIYIPDGTTCAARCIGFMRGVLST